MANLHLVQQIVRMEKSHLARQMEILRRTSSGEHYGTYEIAGSVTLTTSAKHGRKLNHTVGLGLFEPLSSAELEAIVQTYRTTGLPPELDMCSLASQATFDLLSSSDFVPTEVSIDTFERILTDADLDPRSPVPASEITVTESTHVRTFVQTSIAGFRSGGRPEELLGLLGLVAAERPDTTMFLAYRGGELAGAAGMACIEIEADGWADDATVVRFAHFYIDSTLPEFRGSGVHAALLRARLKAARERGCVRAVASARTDSGSARNIVRAGFRKAFESITYTKST